MRSARCGRQGKRSNEQQGFRLSQPPASSDATSDPARTARTPSTPARSTLMGSSYWLNGWVRERSAALEHAGTSEDQTHDAGSRSAAHRGRYAASRLADRCSSPILNPTPKAARANTGPNWSILRPNWAAPQPLRTFALLNRLKTNTLPAGQMPKAWRLAEQLAQTMVRRDRGASRSRKRTTRAKSLRH